MSGTAFEPGLAHHIFANFNLLPTWIFCQLESSRKIPQKYFYTSSVSLDITMQSSWIDHLHSPTSPNSIHEILTNSIPCSTQMENFLSKFVVIFMCIIIKMSKNSSLSYKNQNMCSIQINPKIRSNGSLNMPEIPKKQCNTKLPSDDFISYVLRTFKEGKFITNLSSKRWIIFDSRRKFKEQDNIWSRSGKEVTKGKLCFPGS